MTTTRRSRLAAIIFNLSAIASLAITAHAQTVSGNLAGTILDPSGGSIANAEIKAISTGTGVESVTHSGTTGNYRLTELPAGAYTLEVSASGFTRTAVKNVVVEVSRIATINVTLPVITLDTTIAVESDATIDTTSATLGTTFNDRYSGDLPVSGIGLGVLNLSLLSAGVASNGGLQIGTGPSVGGLRPRSNNFTIDGADNNNRANTGALAQVPNDAVLQFTMLQNQFGSEFGHSSGGQFNMLVKTGTNDLHGSVYEYFQNKNLNAIDQIFVNSGTTTKTRFDSNRFGGTVGGPIRRNKLFYFGNLEYAPTGQASTPGQIKTPTAQGYTTLGSISGLNQTNLGILKQYATAAPSASETIAVNGVPVQIGILPVAAPSYSNATNAVASGDYYASSTDQIRMRYIVNRISRIDNAASFPAFFVQEKIGSHLASISEYHTFSPSLLNEFRIAYTRFIDDTPTADFKFTGLDAFPNIVLGDLQLQLGPDSTAPQFTGSNTYQLADNLTWTRGRHTFKTGFAAQWAISPIRFSQNVRGDYEYSGLDLFLRDVTPDKLAQRTIGNPTYYGNQHVFEAYAADSMRVTPHLTMDLGLRYVHASVPLGLTQQALNSIASVPGLITFNSPKAQFANFAPRVGLAWSPGNSGRTSVRAGFGMGYDPHYDNIGVNSPPPQFAVNVNQTGTTVNGFLANGGITGDTSSAPPTPAGARSLTANHVPDQKLPYSLEWNFGIQHVFAKDFTFETRYVGTRGVHLVQQTRPASYSVVTPTHSLPTYFQRPGQATLDALPLTLEQLSPSSFTLPQYLAAGFPGNGALTEYAPRGNSSYHGLATQLTKRYSKNLQFTAAWTWSHLIDDSTEEFFTSLLTPRRPQDSQNLRAERATSALDRRHRFTIAAIYDIPVPSGAGMALKAIAGGWSLAPIYTWESPEFITALSGTDSNLNNDAYGDRVIVNPDGKDGTGSDVTELTNSAGDIVAYLANNPNARYIVAGPGAYANGGRNTVAGRPTNNLDLNILKSIYAGERVKVQFSAQMLNVLNHAQYLPSFTNRVDNPAIPNANPGIFFPFLSPASPTFNQPETVFSSNPRNIILALKLLF